MGEEVPGTTGAREVVRAWLQLARLPNLFTVPGDPLAGLFLAGAASGPAGLAGVGAAVALYAAGCIANDVADREEDARERPGRPIPSGRVRAGAALGGALLLGGLGLAAAAAGGAAMLTAACALAGAITIYTAAAKRSAFWGPVVMGACRGLSVGLGLAAGGAEAFGRPLAWMAVGGTWAYIWAVTVVSRRETGAGSVGGVRWFPLAASLAAVAGLLLLSVRAMGPGAGVAAALPGLALAGWCFGHAVRLGRGGPVPPVIGRLVRGVILLQSVIMATGGAAGLVAAAVLLLVCWPAHAALGRRFYAS